MRLNESRFSKPKTWVIVGAINVFVMLTVSSVFAKMFPVGWHIAVFNVLFVWPFLVACVLKLKRDKKTMSIALVILLVACCVIITALIAISLWAIIEEEIVSR